MSDCIGEPVSWLRLERYQLGELSDAEQGAVAQHVANCPACGACLQRIEQPIALAPLPLMAAKPKRMFAWSGSVALAAAAAIGLALWRGITPEPSRPAARMRTKGGEFALELVRMDADGRQQTPTHFRAGDRFKVLLTSASEFHGWADVVVFQDGRAYFPIDRAPLEGGNRRTLPGAFQLDGAAVVDVCAVWSESAIDRTQLERGVD
ncbi:MAG TPA: zf-HC2 domain-containing protein, partial [Polyangiales bacterium]